MPRYEGRLPESFIAELEAMTDWQLAKKIAQMRSDGDRPGCATALTLRWVLRKRFNNSLPQMDQFLLLYSRAWELEKAARARGRRERLQNRPIQGSSGRPSRRRSPRERAGHVIW